MPLRRPGTLSLGPLDVRLFILVARGKGDWLAFLVNVWFWSALALTFNQRFRIWSPRGLPKVISGLGVCHRTVGAMRINSPRVAAFRLPVLPSGRIAEMGVNGLARKC